MKRIFQLSRPNKRLISVIIDSAFIIFSFWLALFLRLESTDTFFEVDKWVLLVAVIIPSIIVNIKMGLYRAVIRYLGSQFAFSVVVSVLTSATALMVLALALGVSIPVSIPLSYSTILLVFVGGSRLILRNMVNASQKKKKRNVIIYGAGAAGRQLHSALRYGNEYNPVAFIDDDTTLKNYNINDLKVCLPKKLSKLIIKHDVDLVLLAIPSATKSQMSAALHCLEEYSVKVLTIPGMADIVAGNAKIDDFKEVSIEDLLGRDQAPANPELLHADIKGKVVMVTGAGGSIGSELCRQIVNQSPKGLLLLELTEFALYSIHNELEEFIQVNNLDIELYPLLGSVVKQKRLTRIMESFKVQTVYHAAAYKHVPIVEFNVIEGVRNNVFGTLNCAKAAITANVETFVLISTDKAVRPTNVMGTSKRMAELCLQALANKGGHNTRFCMVRFGNVLGSSGSVVPLFKKQIKKGGPITLTHKDITRYFMTIPEAAQLVIQAGAMGMGGDVFVLDMGNPVRIYDLAAKMVHLSGLRLKHKDNPNGDIEIIETGLRPGEKLYEELLIGEDVDRTGNKRIMTASEVFLVWEKLELLLNGLEAAFKTFDHEAIRRILLEAPTAFSPADGICDLVYLRSKKL